MLGGPLGPGFMKMASALSSTTAQTIATIVFGVIATILAGVTVWQSYKAWSIWQGHVESREQSLESHGPIDTFIGAELAY